MESLELRVPYSAYRQVPDAWLPLLQAAERALDGCYAPYSHFGVAASLEVHGGPILTGTNLENGSYPCGICAERVVLARAHAEYPGVPLDRLLLVARGVGHEGEFTPEPITPCGLCRQSLLEQVQRQPGYPLEVMMVGAARVWHVANAELLLPFAFLLK